FALVDVISPCVTFNDHSGSTKSYLYTRKHAVQATETDFVPTASEIVSAIGESGVTSVTMHDGSVVRFRSVPKNYDPTNRATVMSCLQEHQGRGEIVTGLLYLDESIPDVHEMNSTPDRALVDIPFEDLCPGSAALDTLQDEYR